MGLFIRLFSLFVLVATAQLNANTKHDYKVISYGYFGGKVFIVDLEQGDPSIVYESGFVTSRKLRLAIGLDQVANLYLVGAVSVNAGDLPASEKHYRMVGEFLNSRLRDLRKEGHRFVVIDTTQFARNAFLFYGDTRLSDGFISDEDHLSKHFTNVVLSAESYLRLRQLRIDRKQEQITNALASEDSFKRSAALAAEKEIQAATRNTKSILNFVHSR